MGTKELDTADTLQIGRPVPIDWDNAQRITFFPEGRSTNAAVRVLALDTGDSIILNVRGLTAGVEIGEIAKPLEQSAGERADNATTAPPQAGPRSSGLVDPSWKT